MKLECGCNYCVRNTYIWLLKNDIIWVEIPKNGSYNLKQFRLNYNSEHPIELQPNALISKIHNIDLNLHKRGFVILRNPIDRFKSLVSHYFIQGSRAHLGKHWLNSMGIYSWGNNDILDVVFENWDNIGNISEPHHFNSQASFIPSEFFQMNHMVYNVDEISFMFGLQAGINSSGSSNIKISEDNLEKIIDIYKDDVELYKKYFNVSL